MGAVRDELRRRAAERERVEAIAERRAQEAERAAMRDLEEEREHRRSQRRRVAESSARRLAGYKCNEPTRRSGGSRRCPMLAGWRTPHPGWGRCVVHEQRGERAAWRLAMELAAEDDTTPWDALLKAVGRATARARWVDEQLAEAVKGADGGVTRDAEVKRWLAESRKERTLAGRLAKAAIDAGVAERLVRQVELEGQLVMNAVVAALDKLDLPHEKRMLALDAAADALLPAGEQGGTTVVQGTVLHDDRPETFPESSSQGDAPGTTHGGGIGGSPSDSGMNKGDLAESDEADRDPTEDERDGE